MELLIYVNINIDFIKFFLIYFFKVLSKRRFKRKHKPFLSIRLYLGITLILIYNLSRKLSISLGLKGNLRLLISLRISINIRLTLATA
jgi:hypothetical protein